MSDIETRMSPLTRSEVMTLLEELPARLEQRKVRLLASFRKASARYSRWPHGFEKETTMSENLRRCHDSDGGYEIPTRPYFPDYGKDTELAERYLDAFQRHFTLEQMGTQLTNYAITLREVKSFLEYEKDFPVTDGRFLEPLTDADIEKLLNPPSAGIESILKKIGNCAEFFTEPSRKLLDLYKKLPLYEPGIEPAAALLNRSPLGKILFERAVERAAAIIPVSATEEYLEHIEGTHNTIGGSFETRTGIIKVYVSPEPYTAILAQVLGHEAQHLWQYSGECAATIKQIDKGGLSEEKLLLSKLLEADAKAVESLLMAQFWVLLKQDSAAEHVAFIRSILSPEKFAVAWEKDPELRQPVENLTEEKIWRLPTPIRIKTSYDLFRTAYTSYAELGHDTATNIAMGHIFAATLSNQDFYEAEYAKTIFSRGFEERWAETLKSSPLLGNFLIRLTTRADTGTSYLLAAGPDIFSRLRSALGTFQIRKPDHSAYARPDYGLHL